MATRNTAGGSDDNKLDAIRTSIVELTQSIHQLNGRIDGVVTQQQYLSNDMQRLRNGEVIHNRPMQLSRVTKLDFPKFDGDDVRGWIYRCNQFFTVDRVEDDDKVRIASIHMYKKALNWHQQYTRIHVEDPLAELKHLRQTGTVEAYYDEFEQLLNKVDISVQQAISLFLAGLQKEIELNVRMFRPTSLEDAYSLAKLQEDTIAVAKKRYTPLLPAPRTVYNIRANVYTPAATQTVSLPPSSTQLALPAVPYNASSRYSPNHKCNGQLYSLEVLANEDVEEVVVPTDDSNEAVVTEVTEYESFAQPHLSLNALTGTNNYQTMRVSGKVNKYKVHIVIDSGSIHNFLDYETAKKLGCRLSKMAPMQVNVPGGNKLLTSTSWDKVVWTINSATFSSDMALIPLGGSEMVLGVQWLQTLGDIQWNFEELKMSFKYRGSRVQLRGTRKSELQWLEAKRMPQAHLSSMMLCVYPTSDCEFSNISLTSNSQVPAEITTLLNEFADVFAVPKQLPPQRLKDHKIPLKEGTQPINIRPYRHPPNQKDAIEAMVNELLEFGVIRSSQSPYAAPIVMVKKKDSKCVFATQSVEYLGHVITEQGVSTAPSKIKAITTWPIPKNLKQLRGFLGLTGYYRRFVKDYASIAQPLTRLLKKNAFLWDEEATLAFEKLKLALQTSPQDGHPIAYLSKTLAPRHQSLSTYEKEFLAVIIALDKWRGYLLDNHFKIKTDHGNENMGADALSRRMYGGQLFQIHILKIQSKHYLWKDGKLWRKNKLVVGADSALRTELIHHFHDDSVGGHFWVHGTIHRLTTSFYWKGLRHDVRQYVRACQICQQCKPDLAMSPGLLQPLPIPKRVWAEISMDFIEGLPSSNGKTVILVEVDRLSKYSHFIALKHPFTAHQIATVFIDNVYKLHGLPETIVSDKDKVFLSLFWQELFRQLKAELHLSTAYHPQTDGQTEIVNKSVECYLRCMTGEKPKDWANWLSHAEYWYNTHFHTAIGTTPFEVLYGQSPKDVVNYNKGASKVDLVERSLLAR
ncbi:uncharacterized protein [Rutidosis leptorrhynchoides]|uniref:uncharacterized protein n=1 Tax=Rutidosis leptorrhynchoides TaxID=125765 RepID=UPI003A994A21